MVVDRAAGSIGHDTFDAIGSYLAPGDLLVLNDTKVIRARLRGHRASGGRVELLVLSLEGHPTPAMYRSSKKLQAGEIIRLEEGYVATVRAPVADGRAGLDFGAVDVSRVLDVVGEVPLPPYIRRDGPPSRSDGERYQTVYARRAGSVAAPTAGLHFTRGLLDALDARGIAAGRITLHVGPGTFAPIRDTIADAPDGSRILRRVAGDRGGRSRSTTRRRTDRRRRYDERQSARDSRFGRLACPVRGTHRAFSHTRGTGFAPSMRSSPTCTCQDRRFCALSWLLRARPSSGVRTRSRSLSATASTASATRCSSSETSWWRSTSPHEIQAAVARGRSGPATVPSPRRPSCRSGHSVLSAG